MAYKIRISYNKNSKIEGYDYLDIHIEVLEYDSGLRPDVLVYDPYQGFKSELHISRKHRDALQVVDGIVNNARKRIENLRRNYIPPPRDVII